jgi:hypothetical protein
MKADWDKLGAKYANSEAVLIVDADCTGPAQGTCGSQGVKGYPTIKYYIGGKARDYQGGRDFNSLAGFAESTLNKDVCNALTGKGCKPIQKKFIEANKDKSADELKELIDERKAKFKEAKSAFRDVEKAFKAEKKAFKVVEKKHNMASDILKKLAKAAN